MSGRHALVVCDAGGDIGDLRGLGRVRSFEPRCRSKLSTRCCNDGFPQTLDDDVS